MKFNNYLMNIILLWYLSNVKLNKNNHFMIAEMNSKPRIFLNPNDKCYIKLSLNKNIELKMDPAYFWFFSFLNRNKYRLEIYWNKKRNL